MPEKSSSRIRFDDFVNAVHADPAQVEPTVLLAGYLGRSSEEGNVRVYLDPSLCNWLEIPEADVIHSRPIADSPLGGSQLWVKASAQIKPGAAGAPAPAAGEEGEADKAAVGADTGVFNPMAGAHPTIWTQFCPTGVGCLPTIPCLPPSIGCPPGGELNPPTLGLTCTWHCPRPVTRAACATIFCVQRVGPTGTQGCTQPGHCVGQTGWQGCGGDYGGSTAATVCTQLGCPTHLLGCPSTSTCPPTHMPGCPSTSTCPPTHMPGCPSTSTCPPAALAAVGPTGTQGCTQPGHCVGQTGWQTCACPIGPTGTQGCVGAEAMARPIDPTAATRCFICPPIEARQGPIGPTGTQGCTQPPHCLGQTGWHTCACPPGYTGWQGCVGAQEAREARTNWPACQTLTFDCAGQPIEVWNTGHFCALPRFAGPAQGPVITLLTVSGCPHPSWVDACPTRLCGMTVSGACLPYTMGGCVREQSPPSVSGCWFQTSAPWHC